MQLRFWAATDTGQVRDHNEDNFLVDQNLQLFVVCDGMGGHAAGEVASAVCVRTVREVVAAEQSLLEEAADNPGDRVVEERLKQLMKRAVTTANARIFQMAREDSTRHGMGTTCVAQLVVGKRLFVGHVGDSRIYRLRDGGCEQVTDDHSLLNEMKRQGQVPEDMTEAEFPHNNAVTRAVGVRESVKVDAFFVDLEAGDRLVMCSDGLSEYLEGSPSALSLMSEGEPEETTQRCIDFANQSGGKDNITVVVVDCDRPSQELREGSGVQRSDVIEVLRKTAYFHYLEPPELEVIRRSAERIELEADEDVIADGEDNHRLFLILKGSVSLQLDGEQVSVLTTGEHFGEMALIDAQDEQDENMVAKTLEPSVFLGIGRDQFLQLIRNEQGLAIKLLWNFVQVFADRLQSVPPEFRFMPDEWRSEPEAIADVTPPSGTLVFEEDLDRGEDSEENEEEESVEVAKAPKLPALPPIESVKAGLGTATAPSGGGVDEDSAPASRREQAETLALDAIDREALMERDADGPSVQINSPAKDKPRLEIGEEGEGHGFDRDEPTAQFDEPDFDEVDQREEPQAATASRDELARTVEIDWEDKPASKKEERKDTPGPPPTPGEERDETGQDLRETVSMETDVEKMRRLRGEDTAGSKKPTPSASILKKASRKVAKSPSEQNSSKAPQEEGGERRVAISGRAEVREEEEEPETTEGPKIMVASDLMADGEEVD